MKALVTLVVFVMSFMAAIALPRDVRADMCPVGCAKQTRACLQTARTKMLTCRASCRSTSPGDRSCMRACVTGLRASKQACGSGVNDCLGMCPTPPPPSSCIGAFVDTCGQQLFTCAQGVIASAKACVHGCGSTGGFDCLKGCATGAEQGLAQCAADFASCVRPCHAPPTTSTTLPGTACTTDAQCSDGNPCSVDHCVGGSCTHACVCLGVAGGLGCCPGPSALCIRQCGDDGSGVCGGSCPFGATCSSGSGSTACDCVSDVGGPCGGNIFMTPLVCAPGLVCRQILPDVTGICVNPSATTTTLPNGCTPFFQSGCSQTSDCCQPCGNGTIAPCAVCLAGRCVGVP